MRRQLPEQQSLWDEQLPQTNRHSWSFLSLSSSSLPAVWKRTGVVMGVARTGAVGVRTGAVGVRTGAVGVRTGAVGVRTGAVGVRTGAVGVRTGAVGVRTGAVGVRTGAVGVRTGAVGVRTGAVGVRTGAVGVGRLPVNACVLTMTFGDPLGFETKPIAPSATIASLSCCGVIDGFRCRYNAATPETNGVAILVPDNVFEAVLLVYHALVIDRPGLCNN